jgi:hypothetical protein
VRWTDPCRRACPSLRRRLTRWEFRWTADTDGRRQLRRGPRTACAGHRVRARCGVARSSSRGDDARRKETRPRAGARAR